ncbi:acetyl-CoA decarbonylase/synthase complex subunit delta [Chlamydiota bacterium]
MLIPDTKVSWIGRINEVTIGALKDAGGTCEKTVTIGGQTTLPFLTLDGVIPHKPIIAGYVTDVVPDWPDFVKEAIGKEIASPSEWAQKCVAEFGVDLISIRLHSADPNGQDSSPEECVKVVKDILETVSVPLIVWGCGDEQKDALVLPECSVALRGENCLLGSAKENNYLTMAALCVADNHKLISEAPVDINIAKQTNILLQDAGFDLNNIVMYQATAALGYGFDYVYSIIERSRLAGLKGDVLMACPQLCNIAEEVWRTKEATLDDKTMPGWGDVTKRGPMWESVTASLYLQAGADIVIMAHPQAIKNVKNVIDALS